MPRSEKQKQKRKNGPSKGAAPPVQPEKPATGAAVDTADSAGSAPGGVEIVQRRRRPGGIRPRSG